MKYLSKYKLFESKEETIGSLKSKIFRFYTPIPLSRRKASFVINKMFKYYKIPLFNILTDTKIDLMEIGDEKHTKLKNALRFEEYLNTLLGRQSFGDDSKTDKSSRGFNFEGLVAGFFDGRISFDPNSTYDLSIKNIGNCSVKFVDDMSQSPRLTNISDILKKDDSVKKLKSYNILLDNGIYSLIKSKEKDSWVDSFTKLANNNGYSVTFDELLKDIKTILVKVFEEVDYFVIGHPKDDIIIISVIEKNKMIDFILENGLNSPKGGNSNEVRVSSNVYKEGSDSVKNTIEIDIPKLTLDEIKTIFYGQHREWANDVFGEEWSSKMRTDLVNYIHDNKEDIIKRIQDFNS